MNNCVQQSDCVCEVSTIPLLRQAGGFLSSLSTSCSDLSPLSSPHALIRIIILLCSLYYALIWVSLPTAGKEVVKVYLLSHNTGPTNIMVQWSKQVKLGHRPPAWGGRKDKWISVLFDRKPQLHYTKTSLRVSVSFVSDQPDPGLTIKILPKRRINTKYLWKKNNWKCRGSNLPHTYSYIWCSLGRIPMNSCFMQMSLLCCFFLLLYMYIFQSQCCKAVNLFLFSFSHHSRCLENPHARRKFSLDSFWYTINIWVWAKNPLLPDFCILMFFFVCLFSQTM